MKCDRCGKKGYGTEITVMGTIYYLCKSCITELSEFIEGKELCNCNEAYATVMYEEDGHEN